MTDDKNISAANDSSSLTHTYDERVTPGESPLTADEKTGIYWEKELSAANKSRSHNLGAGDTIVLNEKSYSITGIISESTGEAVIYKIQDQDKKTYALKLYFEFQDPRHEPNAEALARIKVIHNDDILRLYDFGAEKSKYKEKYCFEILDFAHGGDMLQVKNLKDKYTPEFIEHHVVKEIFNGIRVLHANRIYHCDLKPQNVFYLDEKQTDLVIGDYGSCKAYDLEKQNVLNKTSIVKRTDAYTSPEAARNIISPATDYYSLGMILAHILYPEQLTNNTNPEFIDRDRLKDIFLRQESRKPILDFNKSFPRLNNLIEGLTLTDSTHRFGEKELTDWLDGKMPVVNYGKLDHVKPVKIENATISTTEEFLHVIRTRKDWYEELIEDEDTFKEVQLWLQNYEDHTVRRRFVEMVKRCQPLGRRYVEEAITRFFDPGMDITIDTTYYSLHKAESIEKELTRLLAHLDEVWKFTPPEEIGFILFQCELSLRQYIKNNPDESNNTTIATVLLEMLYTPFELVSETNTDFNTLFPDPLFSGDSGTLRLSFIKLFHAFNPERGFRNVLGETYDTPESMGLYLAEKEEHFTNEYNKAEIQVFLKRINKESLFDKNLLKFLFNIFKDQIKSSVSVTHVRFNEKRVHIEYSYDKSLTDYFKSEGVKFAQIEKGESHSLEFTTPLIPRSKQVYLEFVTRLSEKHDINIEKIDTTSVAQTRKFLSKEAQSYLTPFRISAGASALLWLFLLIPALTSIIGFVWIYEKLEIAGYYSKNIHLSMLLLSMAIVVLLIPACFLYSYSDGKKTMPSQSILSEGFDKTFLLAPHHLIGGWYLWIIICAAFLFLFWILASAILWIFSYSHLVTNIIYYSYIPLIAVAIGFLIRSFVVYSLKSLQVARIRSALTVRYFLMLLLLSASSITLFNYYNPAFANSIQKRIPESIAPEEDANEYYILSVPAANFRTGPSVENDVIGVILQGERLIILDKDNARWYKIDYNGTTGWINARMIRPEQRTESQAPNSTPVASRITRGTARVNANRAYFYGQPDLNTRRGAYLIRGQQIDFSARQGSFVYTRYKNHEGVVTTGWIHANDLTGIEPK